MRIIHSAVAVAVGLLVLPGTAAAEENYLEVWSNPSVEVALDERTAVEVETAQRLRSSGDGGRDTYFLRLWAHRAIAPSLTLSGAVEQRWNGGEQEQRLHQQLSWARGAFRSRSRFEQRFVEGDTRMAVRLRQRVGVEVPLSADGKWSAGANVEGFLTLRSGSPGGQTGLTGVRTFAGVEREVGDRLTLSLGYLRAQDIRAGRPDRVGHAPLIAIALSL